MLSRHFLRSKVLQSLYAYTISESDDLNVIEKNFSHNIERLNDLGITQLSTLLYFFDFSKKSMEEAKAKFLPSKEEVNPNMRFVENKFLVELSNNYELKKAIDSLKINWANHNDLFRTLYNTFRASEVYKKYMTAEVSDFKADRDIVLLLFKHIMNYEALVDIFYERNLFWEDDFYQIAQYNYGLLKGFDEEFSAASVFPLVFDKRNEHEVEACEFASILLKKTILSFNENAEIIKQNLKEWEYERVALMDILIIKMAITELVTFSSIPEKVTINECIELSKEYSTDKSKLFVNGILDKIYNELRSQGRIKKSGRGLIDESLL